MSKPDIVLIVADSLRSDHLSCYGYERNTTPFLDSLADRGEKFERVYANANWSSPSHASMFTGKLPSNHKVDHQNSIDFNQNPEIRDFLKEQGYEIEGYSNNPYISQYYGFDQIFDKFDLQLWSGIMDDETEDLLHSINQEDWDSQYEKFYHVLKETLFRPKSLIKLVSYKLNRKGLRKLGLYDSGTKKSLEKIEDSLDKDKPKFVFTNLMEAHEPYIPPLLYPRKFSSEYFPKDGVIDTKTEVRGKKLKRRIDLYDDCIRYLDDQIKEFYKDIEENDRDTIMIVTSDHGELFFDNNLPFEDEKQGHQPSLSDELLQVPLIISDSRKLEISEPFSLRKIPEIVENIIEDKEIQYENPISECYPKNGDTYQSIRSKDSSCYKINGDIYPENTDRNLIQELEKRTSNITNENIQDIDI